MATELERLLVRIDATTEGLRKEIKRGEDAVSGAQRGIDRSANAIEKSFQRLGQAAGLYFGAQGIRQVINYSDSFKQLEGRLNTVTGSTQKTAKAQADLLALSQKSGTSIAANTGLYVRLNQSLDANQKKQFDLLKITETVAKSFAITGESAGAMQGAVTQLAQAIASDFKASSQEINSLIDQAPRLAQVVAQELGLRVPAEMKKMAEAGELSTDKFLSALQRGSATINAEYENMGATVERSLTRLDNAFLTYIGQSDAVANSTNSLSLAIDGIAANFETVADVALVAAGAISGRYISSLVAAQVASYKMARDTLAVQVALAGMQGSTARAATGLLLFDKAALAARGTLALLGGPVGVAITAATAIYAFSDSEDTATTASKNYDDSLKNLNDIKSQMQGTTQTLSQRFAEETAAHIDNTEAVLKETEANLELLKSKLLLNQSNALSVSRTGQVPDQAGVEAGVSTLEEKAASLREEVRKNRVELDAFFSKGIAPVIKGLSGGGGSGGSKSGKGLSGGFSEAAKSAKELQNELDKMQQDAVYEAITMGMDDQAKSLYDVELALDKLEKKYGKFSKAQKNQAETVLEQTRGNLAAKKAIEAQAAVAEKAAKQAEENARLMEQPFINAMENIQNTFTDTFIGIFDGSVNSAADAADAIKGIFIRMAAETATLQLFGAQGLNLASVFGSGGGAGAAGGGLGLGNLASLGSSAMNLFGGGSILTQGLNGVGSLFGLNGSPLAGGIGPSMPLSGYSSLTNGSFGGSLGGMAGGFVGNLGANALFGQRGIGADIGGTLGGIAGSFIPVPILGPMIGSFIGNAIGGLFGNSKPTSGLQTAELDLKSGNIVERGGLRGKKFSQANQDLVDTVSTVTSAMARLTGITDKIAIAVGNRTGFEYAIGQNQKIFDADSPARKQFKTAEDMLASVLDDFLQGATKKLSDSAKAALEKIDLKDATQALSDIELIRQFEELANPVSALDAALEQLREQFEPLIKQAERLGLPVEKITDLYKEQQEILKAAAEAQKAAEVAQLAANISSVLSDIMQKQTDAITEQSKAASEFVQKFTRIRDSFKDFLSELTTGRFSPLHPVARLAAMRGEVESLGAQAQLGNADAAEKLRDLLPAFLELSGEVNGFNEDYATDRQRAEDLSTATLATFTRQISIQEQIAGAAAQQIAVLQDGFNRMVAALAGGKDIFTGGATNAAGRSLSEVTSNGLTVGQVEAIYRGVTGYTGATGSGQLSAAAVGKEAAIVAAMKAAGAKGFASGGFVTGLGGIDTNPAMLTAGEFVVNRDAASRIGAETLHRMNSGGMGANDNGGIEGRIDNLTRVVEGLVRVTAESGNVNASMLNGVQGQLSDIRRNARLEAAR